MTAADVFFFFFYVAAINSSKAVWSVQLPRYRDGWILRRDSLTLKMVVLGALWCFGPNSSPASTVTVIQQHFSMHGCGLIGFKRGPKCTTFLAKCDCVEGMLGLIKGNVHIVCN